MSPTTKRSFNWIPVCASFPPHPSHTVRTPFLLTLLACSLLPHGASAQALATYDFSPGTTTASTATTAASASSIVTPVNGVLTQLTAGAGLVGSDATPNPFTGISTATTGGSPQPGLFVRSTGTDGTSGDTALAANDYYTFTLTPNSGFQLNLSSFTLSGARSAANTNATIFVRSSLDAFATNLGVLNISGATADGVYATLTAPLGAAAFQGLTTAVEFRIGFIDNQNLTTAVDRIDNVVLNGTIGVVPEPGTWVMIAGGLGLLAGAQRFRRRR